MKKRIFVIGYMGTPRREIAEKITEELNKNTSYSETAEEGCKPYHFLDMDREIERLDGRSILRLSMTMGEHEYRNKEYELLSKLDNDDFEIGLAKNETYPEKMVISCGDGVLLDEMCFEILKKWTKKTKVQKMIDGEMKAFFSVEDGSGIVVLEAKAEELWERAKDDKTLPYAFMHTGSEEAKKSKFLDLYDVRKCLYDNLK